MARLRKGYTKCVRRGIEYLRYGFTQEGQRYYIYGMTYKECEEKTEAKKEELRQRLYVKNGQVTLAKYFEEWERSREGTIKPGTMYLCHTRFKAVSKLIGNRRVRAIERREIVKLQQDLLAMGYTTSGVNSRIAMLKSIFESAVTERIIVYNPCKGVKPLKRTEAEARDTYHRALTEEETKLFFQYADLSWYYELWGFMLTTGCRIGEAAALTWRDIDFENKVIHINKTVTKSADGKPMIGSPKSKTSLRDIPLTEDNMKFLNRQREKIRAFSGNVIDLTGTIFKNSQGGLATVYNVEHSIDAVLKAVKKETGVEIEHFSSHAFRDTFATRAIEAGMNANTLKTILGHSSLAMTMDLYAHVMPNTKAEEMKLIRFVI